MNTFNDEKEVEQQGQRLGDLVSDELKRKAYEKMAERLNGRRTSAKNNNENQPDTSNTENNSSTQTVKNAEIKPSSDTFSSERGDTSEKNNNINNASSQPNSYNATNRQNIKPQNKKTQPGTSASNRSSNNSSGTSSNSGTNSTTKNAPQTSSEKGGAVSGALGAISMVGKALKAFSNSGESITNRASIEDDFGSTGKALFFILAPVLAFVLLLYIIILNIMPGAVSKTYTSDEPYGFVDKPGFEAVNEYLENYNYYYFNKTLDENGNAIDMTEEDRQKIVYDHTSLYTGLIDCVFKDVVKSYSSYIETQYEDIVYTEYDPSGVGVGALQTEFSFNYNPEKSLESFYNQPYPYTLKKSNGKYYTMGDFMNGNIPESELNNDLNFAEFMAVLSYNINFSMASFDLINFANYLCDSSNYKYYFEISTTQIFEEYQEVLTPYDCSICQGEGFFLHAATYDECTECDEEGYIITGKGYSDCSNPDCVDGYVSKEITNETETEIEEEITVTCEDCTGYGFLGYKCGLCGAYSYEKNIANVYFCNCDSSFLEDMICNTCSGLGSITKTETTTETETSTETVKEVCETCEGSGRGEYEEIKEICPTCDGEKKILKGEEYKEPCSTCKETGTLYKSTFIYTTVSVSEDESEKWEDAKEAAKEAFSSAPKVGGLTLNSLPTRVQEDVKVLKEANPTAETPVYLREYHIEFTVKPYGLKELYALAGVEPWDYSDKFTNMSYANLLDRTELYYRFLISDVDHSDILGPSYMDARSINSTIYQDLRLINGTATGRSAYQYLEDNESDFDIEMEVTGKDDFRSTEIEYIDDGETVVLDMFSPIYQADNTSSRGGGTESQTIALDGNEECTYAMLLSYFKDFPYDETNLSKLYVSNGKFMLSTFMKDNELQYSLEKGEATPDNIIKTINKGLPVILHLYDIWCSETQSYCQSTPHIILIIGYSKDGFYVYDSGSKANTTGYIPYDMFYMLPDNSYISALMMKNNKTTVSFKIE